MPLKSRFNGGAGQSWGQAGLILSFRRLEQ
jgi:hypothetical protein